MASSVLFNLLLLMTILNQSTSLSFSSRSLPLTYTNNPTSSRGKAKKRFLGRYSTPFTFWTCPRRIQLLGKQQQQQNLRASTFDDFEDFSNDGMESSSSSDIYASLRARQSQISSSDASNSNKFYIRTDDDADVDDDDDNNYKDNNNNHDGMNSQNNIIADNWRNANCSSTIRLALDDWIRKIAVHTYPLAICGSAGGNIYLADLERGEELDCANGVHSSQLRSLIIDNDKKDTVNGGGDGDGLFEIDAMRKLYGAYDGGGVVSIAIHKDIIVSSGREGGARVFLIRGSEEKYYKGSRGGRSSHFRLRLESKGYLGGTLSSSEKSLNEVLVTSVAFDSSGIVWVAGYDGKLRGYEWDDLSIPLHKQDEPNFEMDLGSEILHVSVNDNLGCGVAALANGAVSLFSLDDGEVLSNWKPYGKGSGRRKREFARTAIIVKNDNHDFESGTKEVWSVVCGGSEGTMFQRRLNIDSSGYVSESKPFIDDESLFGRLKPNHSGPVVSLASPTTGLLTSASQDGTIRIWDCSYHGTHDNDEDELSLLDDEDDDSQDDEGYYDNIGVLDRRPKCLYALTGYKVWIGSVFTDGKKLASDGADNTIVVHDFSGEDEETGDFYFGDDDSEEGFALD
eukprot:CAMPEP_0184868548 /NCGR_PEP_ID=MMETSP0580-20130426/30862_1 /TAXON_ID=1118495 /ORGANISM="Dactyliosolen fragilissimus" /LENGTH=623 /DNA_ID=CAMNT_0027369521 /DNA_START=136 /DNA_END=2007 /DNA_ORIENTATION=-